MQKLFVDYLADNGNTGITENKNIIIYNLDIMRPGLGADMLEHLTTKEHFSRAMKAGRFVSITTFSLSGRSMMALMDMRREQASLDDLLIDIKKPEYRQFILDAFAALNNDDSGYYVYELEVGEPPSA